MTDEAGRRHFRYHAVDAEGKVHVGVLGAADACALVSRLQERHLRLLSCRPLWFAPRSLPTRDWIFLFFNLHQGLNAGIPILTCLRSLAEEGGGRAGRLAGSVADNIEAGSSLSRSLADSGGGLDEVFLRLLEAGEKSGGLTRILQELIDCMKRRDALRTRMRSILLYPLFSLILILAVIVGFALWMVPQLQQFLLSMGRELPVSVRLATALVRLPLDQPVAVCSVLAAVVALGIVPVRVSSTWRLAVARGWLKAPYVGTLLRKSSLVRFFLVLRLLYEAGLPLLESLRYARRAAGDAAVASSLHTVEDHVRDGVSLAGAFEQAGHFPPLLVRMIRHGELAGSLGESLQQVCTFYENDLRAATEQMRALLGPAMTLVLGFLLGWTALAFIKPIYELAFSLAV